MTCCLWKALECRRDSATVKQTMLKGPLPALCFKALLLTDFQERRSSVSRLMGMASQTATERETNATFYRMEKMIGLGDLRVFFQAK